MFGLGVMVALGRRVATLALADTGLLPANFYRHLALASLEEEDFPGALKWLPFARDPVLTQLMVLRLRLLAARHQEQRQAVLALLDQDLPHDLRSRGQALLEQEGRALELLQTYTQEALKLLGQPREGKPGFREHPENKNKTAISSGAP